MAHAAKLPRREFARQCLGGIGAASIAGHVMAGEDRPPAPALPEEKPAAKDAPPVELLLLSALIENYPSEHYTDEILRGIYREIAGDQARGRQLRAFPLKNHDEPALVFRASTNSRPVAEGTP